MMVPRTFAAVPFSISPLDEKDILRYPPQKQKRLGSRKISPSRSPPLRPRSTPSAQVDVTSSPRIDSRAKSQPFRVSGPSEGSKPGDVSSSVQDIPRRRESAQEVLAATAIPIRKKPKQRGVQRLPGGDYVSDFSKLLLDDVKTHDGSFSSSLGQYDGLFGNIDELMVGDVSMESQSVDAGLLLSRSISTTSMPSLTSPGENTLTPTSSISPNFARSPTDKKLRLVASSEDSSLQHPLMPEDDDGSTTPEFSISPPLRQRRRPQQRRPGAFKSSLTASLKAIRSAAQSVSNYTASATLQPDEFLSHSIFDIQPSLTDDRRPPPSSGPPSPALRRYLNPNHAAEDSPTQLHFWLDSRSILPPPPSPRSTASHKPTGSAKANTRAKRKLLKPIKTPTQLPPVVPLATCIPSTIRTAHASSPPIWLAPDGTPSNKQTALHWVVDSTTGGLKQREPRENRDFLRVYVAEMQMRRCGKLDEAGEGRAKMWLPPVEEGVKRGRDLPKGEERWGFRTAEEVD